MVKLGYKLMSEEHGPTELVRNAKRAEQVGFEFAAISGHFFPCYCAAQVGAAATCWAMLLA
jgi:alkanesulfonate monooxygenase SsuD/methylene tetrahydromethanopterin reductase-like flavin-dependent oxidoreductase (luciferase family)